MGLLELCCLLLDILILAKRLGSLLLWEADLWAEPIVWIFETGMVHYQAQVRRSALAIFALTRLRHFVKVDWSAVSYKLVIADFAHAVTMIFVKATVDALLGLWLRHLDTPTHK